ncbi:MAG TPA: hypothetical protein P5571_01885 [Candidatus Krumholzibacteria bacterium]|nr:hypothetical protein [Candidatus Krumholzibacteria bacterium]
MSARLWLTAYAGVVLAASFLHRAELLAALLATVLLAAGRRAPKVLKRAALATLLFTGVVVLLHVTLELQRGGDPWSWALRTLLRVLTMTSATMALTLRVDLIRLLAHRPVLGPVLLIAMAQIGAVRRLVRDTRRALLSRSPTAPGPRTYVRHGGATGGALVRRAAREMTVVTRAMTSRGAFLDADPH